MILLWRQLLECSFFCIVVFCLDFSAVFGGFDADGVGFLDCDALGGGLLVRSITHPLL